VGGGGGGGLFSLLFLAWNGGHWPTPPRPPQTPLHHLVACTGMHSLLLSLFVSSQSMSCVPSWWVVVRSLSHVSTAPGLALGIVGKPSLATGGGCSPLFFLVSVWVLPMPCKQLYRPRLMLSSACAVSSHRGLQGVDIARDQLRQRIMETADFEVITSGCPTACHLHFTLGPAASPTLAPCPLPSLTTTK